MYIHHKSSHFCTPDISGPRASTHALLILYDIFGYYPQTLRGADILASSAYLTIMPDFFDGHPAEYSWYPPSSPEKEENLNTFLAGPAETQKTLSRLWSLKASLELLFPSISSWALLGYCWGGYVAFYAASRSEKPFATCVHLHPGFPSPEVAAKIAVPVLVLNSRDEIGEEERPPFEEALGQDVGDGKEIKDRSRILTFEAMEHGWMSARANLEDESVRQGYERGYEIVREWLQEHFT
ncbi:MAG: hypothetical protein Q9165_000284 [Trypethelium subeluteriae]